MVDSMNIYIYPNTPSDDDLISEAKEGLEAATSQTISYFHQKGEAIGREINVVKKYPNIVEPDVNEDYKLQYMLNGFRAWRSGNDAQQTGEHLLLSHLVGAGYAKAKFGGAWRNPPMSIATKVKGQKSQYFRSLCIHETYHNFINIGSAFGAGSGTSDHELGYVNPNTMEQTPMLNGYWGDGPDTRGDCSNTSNQKPPYSLQLSDCALEATLKSYRNQGEVL